VPGQVLALDFLVAFRGGLHKQRGIETSLSSEQAFSRSGRLSVMVAILSDTSSVMVS
jgi:hypothetical protein